MRVQLSPWEVSKTSIRVPSSKSQRVRKLSTNDDENDVSSSSINGYHDRSELPSEDDDTEKFYRFSARFVEHSRKSTRSWKKKGKTTSDSSDVLPSVVVTGEHQIRMIGKSANSDISESINLNLTSPVGINTSFLPGPIGDKDKEKNGIRNGFNHNVSNGKNIKKSSHNSIKSASGIKQGLHLEDNHEKVPAVYDNSMDVIFALQKRNTKLVCWRGESSSFVDVLASTTMQKSATSLSLLQNSRQNNNNSIVVGSCRNGSLFFAQLETVKQSKDSVSDITSNNRNVLKIQYLPTRSKENLESAQFVGHLSFVAPYVKSRNEDTVALTVGSKRKVVNSDNNIYGAVSILIIYRFYVEKDVLEIVKNEIEIDKDGNIALEESSSIEGTVVASVNLDNIFSHNDEMGPARVTVVGFGEGRNSACIAIQQRSTYVGKSKSNGNTIPDRNENSGTRHCYFNVSLENGVTLGVPVHLPINTKKVRMVGSSVVAVETHSATILFYDSARGNTLFSQSANSIVPDDIERSTIDWFSLYTDTHRPRVALLYVKQGSLYIACSTIVTKTSSSDLDDSNSQNVLMLSSGRIPLAHGLMTYFAGNNTASKLAEYYPKANQQPVIQVSVRSGLDLNEDTYSSIRQIVDEAIALVRNSLLGSSHRLNPKNGSVPETPLQLLEAFAKGIELVSDCQNATDDSEPQSFVDGIIQLFCQYVAKISTSTIQQQKLSMIDKQRLSGIHSILQICVRSGKFSCRQHLQPLFNVGFTMGLLKEGHIDPSSSNSPVELVLDILDTCSDASERQQIIFLRYMLSKAKPADIANSFQQDRLKEIDQRCTNLGHQFVSFSTSAPNSSNTKEIDLDRVSKLLIIAGVDTVIDKLSKMPDANESLLRTSINDELDYEEIQLLYQLFAKSLKTNTCTSCTDQTSAYQRKLQWVNALQACQPQNQHHDFATAMISAEADAMERTMFLNEIKRNFDAGTKSKSRSLSTSARMMNSFDDSYIVEIL